jgi:NAD(P)H-dependent flavin oxidoreductase YrpB (nitropropane dioxygenase family)
MTQVGGASAPCASNGEDVRTACEGNCSMSRDDRQANRVNLTFLPTFSAPPYPEYIEAIKEGGIKAVETAGRSPEPYMPAQSRRHQGNSQTQDRSVRLKAQSIGCDAVSVDDFECSGHPGEDDTPNMVLLPRAADELKILFAVSGGVADGRGLVAALALGAEGMTPFLKRRLNLHAATRKGPLSGPFAFFILSLVTPACRQRGRGWYRPCQSRR